MSIAARLVRRFVRARIKTTPLGDDFVYEIRRRMEGGPNVAVLGRSVARRVLADGSVWIGIPGARRTVLYFHGGGYVAGRPATYANLCGRIAVGIDGQVYLPRYRLAPEHPFPGAVEDGLFAYHRLLDDGIDPSRLVVAGDSAGGGLTLATLLRAAEAGLPMPAAAVLLSPWTDLTASGASVSANDRADDMLSAEMLGRCAGVYLDGADAKDPEASPLWAAPDRLGALPPLLITVDDSEVLLDDALRLADRVRAGGGTVEVIRGSGLFHVWPVLVPVVPEATRTVGQIVDFLGRNVSG